MVSIPKAKRKISKLPSPKELKSMITLHGTCERKVAIKIVMNIVTDIANPTHNPKIRIIDSMICRLLCINTSNKIVKWLCYYH